MIPADFRQHLMQVHGGETLSSEELLEGEGLYAKLSKEEKNNPHVYCVIVQGIKLLTDLGTHNIEDTKFKEGFSQIRLMSEEDLKKTETHQLVAKKILEPQLPPLLQKVHETSNRSWDEIEKTYSSKTVVVTKAHEIGHGAFATVMKVDDLANEVIPQSGVAIKIAPRKDISAMESIKKEIAFLNAMHASDKLSGEEKAALFPKPVKVTYEKGLIFKTPHDGYMTKFFNGSSLMEQLPKLSMQQKIDIATQLIYQLALISKVQGCHPDLKLENFLVDSSTDPVTVKIADYGSCFFTDKPENVIPVTSGYTMMGDYNRLTRYSNLAASKPDDPKLKEELAAAANQIMSRTMGFALMILFSGKVPPFCENNNFYTSEARSYIDDEAPLQSLEGVNKNLASIVLGLLMPGAKPLDPQDAWKQWSNAL